MTPEEKAEIAMCNECISHLLENAGPDHIIVKYRNALVELNVRGEKIERLRAVAGAFQPGDAEMIKSMADRIMGVMLQSDAEKACLRRLQAAAEVLES